MHHGKSCAAPFYIIEIVFLDQVAFRSLDRIVAYVA